MPLRQGRDQSRGSGWPAVAYMVQNELLKDAAVTAP